MTFFSFFLGFLPFHFVGFQTERSRGGGVRVENSNSNSETLFYKDCSLCVLGGGGWVQEGMGGMGWR